MQSGSIVKQGPGRSGICGGEQAAGDVHVMAGAQKGRERAALSGGIGPGAGEGAKTLALGKAQRHG